MQTLGIHLDFPYLRTARLRKGRKGIQFLSLETIPFPEKGVVKPLYNKSFQGKIGTGLEGKQALIRSIEIKKGTEKHAEEVASFQGEAGSHFKKEEAITVAWVDKEKREEALLFTVLREDLNAHLKQFLQIGIDPDGVSTIPSAIGHFIRWKLPSQKNRFVIDLGSNEVNCIWMEQGKLKKSHSIPKGIENLLAALHEDRRKNLLKSEIEGAAQQIDLLLLKPGLNPSLSKELQLWLQEIGKIRYSFDREKKGELIFTGRTDSFIHLCEFLADGEKRETSLSKEEEKFSASMGLALEMASFQPVQLRQEEFFPQKHWRRFGKYALSILIGSIGLSGALIGFGARFAQTAQTKMWDSLETPFKEEIDPTKSSQEKIESWIKAVETNDREYPYLPQTPKVLEALSWISNHPLLEQFKKEGDPIEFLTIRYRLSSFPAIHSKKSPFLGKLEIEFRLKNRMNARKFHASLRRGDRFVDPSLEISWDPLKDRYRASFFIKNRVPYVP